MSSTNKYTLPTCENCGRDKQATYICDPCCDKLNAITRATREERDRLAAEVDELRGKLSEYESECYALRAVTAEKNSDILRKRVKARDEVITKLLALVKPEMIYRRACEIAGRME